LFATNNSHFGFDGLATRNRTLAINETQHLFVEFKMELRTEFNHTFERLEAIVCWNSRVKSGSTMTDLTGRKGVYTITDKPDGTRVRLIMVGGSPRNVEVIFLGDLLEHQGHKFRPVGE
jgi:hypothetical protein